ncbi:MAG TPA: serpin family protein [Polyangia bacterium]|nr:serpin family protein [Polyangia bacterium]
MKMITSFRSLLPAAAALFAACNGSGSAPTTPGATEVRSSQVRVTAPVVLTGDLATLAADNRHFAWDLYQAVAAGSSDNLVFSPASISIALGMTYGGAGGATATQMASTLHFSLPPARLHATFDALDLALEAPPPAGNSGAFQLSLANAIWGQQGFPFVPAYLDLLAEDYGAGLHVVDFAGATEAARQTINQWVSDATDAQIPMLLAPGVLDPSTRLVLTNAVYFHADWQSPFKADSPMGMFNAPTGAVQVPMMIAGDDMTTLGASGTGYTMAVLPYKGKGTSMVLIVPDANTFDAFTSGLTFDALETILASPTTTQYFVSMPRFKFQTALGLSDTLIKMGMTDAFKAGGADFSGIDGSNDLFIQAVIHEATIAVDEKGTTAAAATAVGVGLAIGRPGEPLVVDRPFLFAIRDDATGSILFLGRVLDPSKM